ncbi:PilN domain-containing protein [Rhodoferax sp. GW822-FHT02A01]|uniref:PilN domain-containing protein n=1 Tax=Rhodoferax sp. GW822-FHT02A01 TaxID=3141537 RepID=UPI00315DE460
MQALNIRWSAGKGHLTPMGVLLAAAGLLCAAWVAQDYLQADAEWQTLQARQARQSRASQGSKRNPVSIAPLARDDAQSASQIDAQLHRPWDALLRAVERLSTKDVALISIEVQATEGSLRLTGEAKDMEHALVYVKTLRRSPELRKVYLTGQEEKLSGTQKVVRFSLDASWVDAS